MLKGNCGHHSLSKHEDEIIFYTSMSITPLNLEDTYVFFIHLNMWMLTFIEKINWKKREKQVISFHVTELQRKFNITI